MKRFDVVKRKNLSTAALDTVTRRKSQFYDRDTGQWYDRPDRPITRTQKERSEYARQCTWKVISKYRSVFLSRKNALCIPILYNVANITSTDHFKQWFQSYADPSDIHLEGNTLIVPIPVGSMTHLRNAFFKVSIRKLCDELLMYFNEAGMDEFFHDIYEIFAVRTAKVENPEEYQKAKALENVKAMLQQAREEHEQHDRNKYDAIQRSDFLAIRDTRIKTHCRVGRMW